MKYIEIDGERIEVQRCKDCPCFDHGEDGRYEMCRHPSRTYREQYKTGSIVRNIRYVRKTKDGWLGSKCPLREVGE